VEARAEKAPEDVIEEPIKVEFIFEPARDHVRAWVHSFSLIRKNYLIARIKKSGGMW
jgi:hypothetical protein